MERDDLEREDGHWRGLEIERGNLYSGFRRIRLAES